MQIIAVLVRSDLAPRDELMLAGHCPTTHAPVMFVVTEADATAIRAAYEQRGEFAATVELRRLFPGLAHSFTDPGRGPAPTGSRFGLRFHLQSSPMW